MNLMLLRRYLNLRATQSDELNFFTELYPEHPDVKLAITTVQQIVFGGTVMGLSLASSLRRYMPSTFGQPSFHRMGVDLFLACGGFLLTYSFALDEALSPLANLRKKLLFQHHQQYLMLLKNAYFKGGFRSEAEMLFPLLGSRDYQLWLQIGPALGDRSDIPLAPAGPTAPSQASENKRMENQQKKTILRKNAKSENERQNEKEAEKEKNETGSLKK